MDTELDQAIRELICTVYDVHYIGKLKVTKMPTGYELMIAFDVEEKPLRIYADLEWEDFLVFIEKELRARHFHSAHYYTGYRIVPEIKHSC